MENCRVIEGANMIGKEDRVIDEKFSDYTYTISACISLK